MTNKNDPTPPPAHSQGPHDNQAGPSTPHRREFLAKTLMTTSLVAGYGTLAGQGILFVVPEHTRPRTRRIFAGRISQYQTGAVQKFYDLQGNVILVKRDKDDRGRDVFKAFSSTCPHLGCKVIWQQKHKRFFCPCHMGVFDKDGVATAGPPAAAGQKLTPVPVVADPESGVVYLEVKEAKKPLT